MSRTINAVCTGIGLVALAGGTFVAIYPARAPTMTIPQFQLDRLQRLAEASCRCERRAGRAGGKQCWAEFERRMPGSEEIGMCEPSVQTRCTGAGMFGNDCVDMRYEFEGHQLCTEAEVSTMEAVFYAEMKATDWKGPIPKTEQLYRDMIAGRPLPNLTGPRGCGG